jgi:hypothetical protein
MTAYFERLRLSFPAPWTVSRIADGWRIEDANGDPVSIVYGGSNPKNAGNQPSIEEALRIAVRIASVRPGEKSSSISSCSAREFGLPGMSLSSSA